MDIHEQGLLNYGMPRLWKRSGSGDPDLQGAWGSLAGNRNRTRADSRVGDRELQGPRRKPEQVRIRRSGPTGGLRCLAGNRNRTRADSRVGDRELQGPRANYRGRAGNRNRTRADA